MHRLLLRYTQALVTQMFQTAACNRHHSVDQQLCRWLLLTLDRCRERTGHDPGTGRQHARRAPGRHYRGCRKIAASGISAIAAATLRCSSGRGWNPRVRVLRGGQEGAGPPAVRCAAPSGSFRRRLTVRRPAHLGCETGVIRPMTLPTSSATRPMWPRREASRVPHSRPRPSRRPEPRPGRCAETCMLC